MTPIVLIPGMLCSAEVWAPQTAALWPYGPVQIASTTYGATMPDIARNILNAAPPRFALAGVSMGGYLCFEILRQAPERVLRLALLDTSARPDTPEQSQGRRAFVDLLRAGDHARLLDDLLAAVLHPDHQQDPNLRAINLRMALTVGIDGLAVQTEAIVARPDSRPGLAAITVPTLVMVGDADPLTPPECSEEIAAAIPHSHLVVVPRCGHNSTLEQPEVVSAALIEWISPS